MARFGSFRTRQPASTPTVASGPLSWLRTAAQHASSVMHAPTPFDTVYRWFAGADGVIHHRDTCQYLTREPVGFDASVLDALAEPFCYSCFNVMHAVYLGNLPTVLQRVVEAETVLATPVPDTAGIAELAQAAVYLQHERYGLGLLGGDHPGIDLHRGSPSILERYDARTAQVVAATRARRWESLELLREWATGHPDGVREDLLDRLEHPASLVLTGVAVNERGLDLLEQLPQALIECWVERRRYHDSLALLAAPVIVADWLASESGFLTSAAPLFPAEQVVTRFDVTLFDAPDTSALLDTALTLWDPFTDGAYRRFGDALGAARSLHE
jgi:hypothetical protein